MLLEEYDKNNINFYIFKPHYNYNHSDIEIVKKNNLGEIELYDNNLFGYITGKYPSEYDVHFAKLDKGNYLLLSNFIDIEEFFGGIDFDVRFRGRVSQYQNYIVDDKNYICTLEKDRGWLEDRVIYDNENGKQVRGPLYNGIFSSFIGCDPIPRSAYFRNKFINASFII